jgi:hypothetical protein
MKTVTISLPEDVNERDFKMAVAAILFDKAILSSGQAAILSEYPRENL